MGLKGPIGAGERVYAPEPFEDAPPLGRRPGGGKWPAATKDWWEAVSTLPHAADWRAADWESARMAALIHARLIEGDVARAGELRLREERMGATEVGRARLGIRYESAPTSAGKPTKPGRTLRLVDDALEA